MKIFCPACGRQYTIDDAKIPPKGLLVKCSVCGAEFRAKKEAVASPAAAGTPASPGEPEPSKTKKTEAPVADELDGLFDDLAGDKPAPDAPTPRLDVDSLREKYEKAAAEEDALPDIHKDREPEIKRSGTATIPSVPPEEPAAPLIERNEDYVAQPSEPAASEAVREPRKESAPQKSAAPKDMLDSLFDDLGGGGKTVDEEKTVNMNLADLASPVIPKRTEEPPVPPIPTRAERKAAEKQARAPEGIGTTAPDAAPEKDMLADLFSDMQSAEEIEQRIVEKSVLLGAGAEEPPSSADVREIYVRRRQTNEVLGPFPEKTLGEMLGRKEVTKNDFVSYVGIRWEPIRALGSAVIGQTITASTQHLTDEPGLRELGELPKSGLKLSVAGGGRPEGAPTAGALFSDSVSTFDDEAIQKRDAVEHTVIPETEAAVSDPFAAPLAVEKAEKKKKKKKRSGSPRFAFKIIVVFFAVAVIAGGGAWWWQTHRKPKVDVLERISETFTEATGTLADVRGAMVRDTRQDYLRCLGILKPYFRGEEIPPAVVGLDAQAKMFLLLSYQKKVEPLEALADRVEAYRQKNPNDTDLTKAAALIAVEKGDFERAAALLEHADKNDADVFYIFGLIAKKRNDQQAAEKIFYEGYTASGGSSNRIAFEMAVNKEIQGDLDGAVAVLNTTIETNPYYMRAYLKKAEILAYGKRNYEEAIRFLAAIGADVLSQADEGEKARYYAVYGDLHYRKGAPEEAIESYKRAVAIEKDNIDYLAVLAKIYQETNQASLALEHYDRALAVNNRHVPSIIGKAEIFVRLRKYNEAFLEIAKIDVESVGDAGHLLRLGNLYFRQGERERALQLYERAIKIEPGLIDAYLGRVFVFLEAGAYDEIRKIAENVGTLGKESYGYYLIKGILGHADGDFRKAEEAFRRAIELNAGEDPRVFFHYGRLLLDRENNEAAAEQFSRAVKLSPDDPDYRVALAQALDRRKKYKEVLEVLEQVEGQQKVHAKAAQLRAEAFFRTGAIDEALKQIEAAIKIDAKNPFFFYKKGEILYAREDYQAATVAVETALMLDIKHFDSYVLFAKVLLKKGDFKTAVEKLEEAQRIDAGNQQVFLLKGILLKNLDNYPEALRNFRKIKNNPDLEKEALLEIGECYLNLDRIDEALKYFTQAAKAGNKAAYRFLARIYYDRNNLDKAAQYYQQTLKAFPDDPEPIKQLGYIAKERQKYAKARSYFKRYLSYLKPGDPERRMMEDEIFYSEKNIGGAQLAKIRREEKEEEDLESREKSGDETADETENEEAKRLYMEAMSLLESDRKEAQKLLKRIVAKTPASNRYFIKARKLLKKMKEEDEDI